MDAVRSTEPDEAHGVEHTAAPPSRDPEKQGAVHTNGSDIEAAASSKSNEGVDSADDSEFLLHRPDKTELTPAEALKWNVDGDQSPCEYCCDSLLPPHLPGYVLSSRFMWPMRT